jgi:hypothetical protein
MDIDEALRTGVWAIAFTPAGKYIGQLWGCEHGIPFTDRRYFIEHIGNPIRMRYPLEFFCTVLQKTTMTERGPIPVLERLVQAQSVSHILNIEQGSLILTPCDYAFFEDMAPSDRHWHEELIRNGIRIAMDGRAQAMGLVTGKEMHTGHA